MRSSLLEQLYRLESRQAVRVKKSRTATWTQTYQFNCRVLPLFCSVPLPLHTLLSTVPSCDAAARPLHTVQREKLMSGEKWTGSERDWGPSSKCDAVTSTPAPFLPYQAARAPLIELAASQSLVEIDCVGVSITSYTPRCPALWFRPLLVIYLLWAFLI